MQKKINITILSYLNNSLSNTTATANAAYGMANRIKPAYIAVEGGTVANVFTTMNNGDLAYGHAWTPPSDSHPSDTRGCYHFYEYYRGSNDYAVVNVYSTFGNYTGCWDTTNGLIWMSNTITNFNFSLSDTTLTITI